MKTRLATYSDKNKWNDFLIKVKAKHHAWDWEWLDTIEEELGHKSYKFVCEEGDKIIGVLPLVHLKSFLFGNSLTSMPLLNAGGILSSSKEASVDLLNSAKDLGSKLGVDYIELRQQEKLQDLDELEIPVRDHKISMILELAPTSEEAFKAFPGKLRSQIRRPTKDGMIAKTSGKDIDLKKATEDFYKVFSENMRDLGTPVYSKKFMAKVFEKFQDRSAVVVVYKDETPVAASFLLKRNNYVEIPWASSLSKWKRSSPNMLLYWKSIEWCIEQGAEYFDFGRSSKDSGTFKFKKQWGSEPLDLHWYYPLEGGEVPDVNPNSAKFNLLVSCWQKLPHKLANIIGPFVSRNIP